MYNPIGGRSRLSSLKRLSHSHFIITNVFYEFTNFLIDPSAIILAI